MVKTDKHILFITISNLANNPRLFKEVCLALDNKLSVTIIQFSLGNWSDIKTESLIEELNTHYKSSNVTVNTLDGTRSSKVKWLFYGLLEKLYRIISPILGNSLQTASFAHSKRSAQIIHFLNKKEWHFNLISGHNLGALYPAAYLSHKTETPFGFDVEDYHPEECIGDDAVNEKKRRIFLMQKLLPKAGFFTSASPLIGEYTVRLVGNKKNHTVILNTFPRNEFELNINNFHSNDVLRFVWFSQNIALGRGLEQFFDGLNYWLKGKPNAKISITLIGNIYEDFQKYINEKFAEKELKNQILIEHIAPLTQKELHKKLSEFDVGIASEQTSSDFNREICLTNKIIAYAQAGLYILATDTKAQIEFLKKYNGIGVFNNSEPESFALSLDYIWENKIDIIANRSERLQDTAGLNWENESKALLETWNKIMN